jgi:hypothetical protein
MPTLQYASLEQDCNMENGSSINSSEPPDRVPDSLEKVHVGGVVPLFIMLSSRVNLSTLAKKANSKRTERFLMELANHASSKRLFSQFGDLLPTHGGTPENLREATLMLDREGTNPEVNRRLGFLAIAAEKIREAWKQPTALGRQVSIMTLVGQYFRDELVPDLAVDGFLMALVRGMYIAEHMRYCANPECPAPYFVAGRRSQRFCSDACAVPAQKRYKQEWWEKHGDAWRKMRRRRAKRIMKGSKAKSHRE